jgi:hypothetical protein
MHREKTLMMDTVPAALPVTTPLRLLANSPIYPGCSIVGQSSGNGSPESWPELILKPITPP